MTSRVFAALSAIVSLMLTVALPAEASHAGIGVFVDASSQIAFTPTSDTISTDVECTDLNGDGDQDLYVTRGDLVGGARKNLTFGNNGAGSFSFVKGAGRRAVDNIDVSIGDFTGDGFEDALIAVNLGGERALIHDGVSRLLDFRVIPGPQADRLADQSTAAELVDVDTDGDLDIVVANQRPGATGAQNFLWINDGTGFFVDRTATSLPAALDQTFGFAFGDIDTDGDVDLIAVNEGQDAVLVNDGTGDFADETAGRLPAESFAGRHGVLADVDGDGDLDYLQGNGGGQQSRLYLNDGVGQFEDVTATHLPQLLASTQDVDVADIDGDGDPDAYLSNVGSPLSANTFTGEQDAIWENDGTGHFVDVTVGHLPSVIDSSFGAALCDVDGDGDLDVTVSNGKAEPLKLYVQT